MVLYDFIWIFFYNPNFYIQSIPFCDFFVSLFYRQSNGFIVIFLKNFNFNHFYSRLIPFCEFFLDFSQKMAIFLIFFGESMIFTILLFIKLSIKCFHFFNRQQWFYMILYGFFFTTLIFIFNQYLFVNFFVSLFQRQSNGFI